MKTYFKPKFIIRPCTILCISSLLYGCGGGSSPTGNNPPTRINIGLNVPATITAGESAPISVELTPQLRSSSNNSSKSTEGEIKNVTIYDNSNRLNCGASKPVTVGGPAVTFLCTAPNNVSDLGYHEILANVGGIVSKPKKIEVLGGGQVSLTLSKSTINAGSETNIIFKKDSTKNPDGKYTLENPGNHWILDPENGTCSIDSTNTSCTIKLTAPENHKEGIFSLSFTHKIGSSLLNPKSLKLTIINTPDSGSDLALKSLTGATSTLIFGHKYKKSIFTFENQSKKPITLYKDTGIASSGTYTDITNSCKSGTTISPEGITPQAGQVASCQIQGTIYKESGIKPIPIDLQFHFSYKVDNSGNEIKDMYSKNIIFVPEKKNYWPIRINNLSSTKPLYFVVEGQKEKNVNSTLKYSKPTTDGNFDLYNNGSTFDQCSSNYGCNYQTDSYKISANGQAIVYIPALTSTTNNYGYKSGVIYLSYANPIQNGNPPPVMINNTMPTTKAERQAYNTQWAQFEFGLFPSTDSNSKPVLEYNADITAVNQVSLPIKMEMLDTTPGKKIHTGSVENSTDSTKGIRAKYWSEIISGKLKSQDILTDIKNIMTTTITGQPQNSGTQNLSQLAAYPINSDDSFNKTLPMIRIISPTNTIGLSNTNPFYIAPYFTNGSPSYSEVLWDYYKTNTLKVNVASEIPNCPNDYSGRVTEDSNNNYKLTFTSTNGSGCNSSGAPTGTVIFDCPATGGCPANGLPDNNDFFGAAPGSTSVLWGSNGTPKSVIGEAIVSAQAVGLMPYPSNEVLSKEGLRSHMPSEDGGKNVSPTYFTGTQTLRLTGYNYNYAVYNLYAKGINKYYNTYGYGYGDYQGLGGDVSNINVSIAPLTVSVAP